MTLRYAHLSPEHLQREIAKTERKVGAPRPRCGRCADCGAPTLQVVWPARGPRRVGERGRGTRGRPAAEELLGISIGAVAVPVSTFSFAAVPFMRILRSRTTGAKLSRA